MSDWTYIFAREEIIYSGGNMEKDNKTCGSAYEIAGYFVQNNGFVRNCSGEYIGQLSDLEECEARGKLIKELQELKDGWKDLALVRQKQLEALALLPKPLNKEVKGSEK